MVEEKSNVNIQKRGSCLSHQWDQQVYDLKQPPYPLYAGLRCGYVIPLFMFALLLLDLQVPLRTSGKLKKSRTHVLSCEVGLDCGQSHVLK